MNIKNTGYETLQIQRFNQQKSVLQQDEIVQEYPVALVYNGISHAVMMATPKDLEVFAIGFSLSEGIVKSFQDIYAIDVIQNECGIQVDIEISSQAFMALKEHRRMLVGRTGCGVCGIESLQQLDLNHLKPISTTFNPLWLAHIPQAISQLKAEQHITQVTGGAHAAAWVVDGKIQVLFEDVGRHNALDKLLGYISKSQLDVSQGFVVMTSRASYELVKKCTQFNIALLACISAPTTLAIHLAKQAKLNLAGFCRNQGFVLYTDPMN